MAEKAITRETVWGRVWEFIRDNAIWTIAGFIMEIACSGYGISVGGAALAAGLSGTKRIYALGGAVFGALLHGFPEALAGLAEDIAVFARAEGLEAHARAALIRME